MKRRLTIATLTAAAVIGSAGGVTVALANDDDPAAGRDDAPTSDSSPTGTTSAPDPSDLFYFTGGVIHDGDAEVEVPGVEADRVITVQRARDGWLVVETVDDPVGGDRYGTYVGRDGEAWRIGSWSGAWDLNADLDRVVYSADSAWKVAVFADRKVRPLDIVDGVGTELDVMTGGEPVPGIAITETGVVTGWTAKGRTQLVETETDHWSHTRFGRPGLDVPVTPPDGQFVAAAFANPDYGPTVPVGSCLTGGPTYQPDAWWSACEIGAVSASPYSPDGDQLLVETTVGDGPAPSGLKVLDAATGRVLHEVDPGDHRVDAAWGEKADTIFTVTMTDTSADMTISRCVVASGTCESVLESTTPVLLGSR